MNGLRRTSAQPKRLYHRRFHRKTKSGSPTRTRLAKHHPKVYPKRVQESLKEYLLDGAHLRSIQVENDPVHYETLKAQILKAMIEAPRGQPMVVLGVGTGNELPGEIFNEEYQRKFPLVVLVDAHAELPQEGLKRFSAELDIPSQLKSKRLRIVETDLSGVNPQATAFLVNEALKANSLEEAKTVLSQRLTDQDKIPKPFILPDQSFRFLGKNKAGLVVSSTLFPDCGVSFYHVIERLVRMALEPNFNPHFPAAFNFSLTSDISVNSIWAAEAIKKHHQQMLRDLVSPNGLVSLTAHVAMIHPNQIKFNFQLPLEKLINHYKNILEGPEKVGQETYNDSIQFHQALMQYINHGFIPYSQLGMILSEPAYDWVQGYEIVSTDVWAYHNLPRLDQGTLVQSLLLTPSQ